MSGKIDFTNRVAIVTGAGAGLGRQHAIELAKRGAKVVVNDLGGSRDGVGSNDAAAKKVVEEIKAFGGVAVPNYDSVSTPEGGENIVKTAIENFGKVDILINNAGILRDKSFTNMEESNWDAVVDVHLKGAYCVTKPAFINMKAGGYGRIVMTTSGAGLFGNSALGGVGAGLAGFAVIAVLDHLVNPTRRIREALSAETDAFVATVLPEMTAWLLEQHQQVLDTVAERILARYREGTWRTVRQLTREAGHE